MTDESQIRSITLGREIILYHYLGSIRYIVRPADADAYFINHLRNNKDILVDLLCRLPHHYFNGASNLGSLNCIVRISAEPAGNFFCFHPVTGSAWCYKALAIASGLNRSIYGVHAPGFGADWRRYPDINDIVPLYCKEILAVQSEGPYVLCGYSMGGLIALEVAEILRRFGHRVFPVFLIDTKPPPSTAPIPDAVENQPISSWRYFISAYADGEAADTLTTDRSFLLGSSEYRFVALLTVGKERGFFEEWWDIERLELAFSFQISLLRSLSRHSLSEYSTDAIYIRAAIGSEEANVSELISHIRGRVKVIDAPGDHLTMMLERNNSFKLCGVIQGELDQLS